VGDREAGPGVAALAAGYEQHYLADLPAAATAGHRGDVVAEAVKDTVVELGMARVTGINAASNLVRFADELVNDHPRLLAGLEAGRISSWNIRAVLAETRVLPSSLRRLADAELAAQLPGMSWSEATQGGRPGGDRPGPGRRGGSGGGRPAGPVDLGGSGPGRDGRAMGEPARRPNPGLLAGPGPSGPRPER
jgi:hypothetical protein